MSEINQNIFEGCPANGLYRVRKKEESGVITYGGYLMHYGIKGQKWGLRRFQNEDRTLTAEGKERYSKESREERKAKKAEEKARRKAEKEAAKPESARWKASEAGFLSDEELNRRNSRLQREQQYRNMTKSTGRKVLESLVGTVSGILIGSLIGSATNFMKTQYTAKINEGARWMNNNTDLMKLKVNEKAI